MDKNRLVTEYLVCMKSRVEELQRAVNNRDSAATVNLNAFDLIREIIGLSELYTNEQIKGNMDFWPKL